jgi:hypothetical protein
MMSATLIECISPAEPPATVKSWLARCTRRPFPMRRPGHHPVGGSSLPCIPNSVSGGRQTGPLRQSCLRPPAAATRSRAVSLPLGVACPACRHHRPGSGFSLAAAQFFDFVLHAHGGSCLCAGGVDGGHGHAVRAAIELHVVDHRRSNALVVPASAPALLPAASGLPGSGSRPRLSGP